MVQQQPSIALVEITPEIAEKFIATNPDKNRKLKTDHVAAIAKALREGRLPFNGDTIRFNQRDEMIDGQHRCHAIVQTGISLVQVVVRGVEDEAVSTIDVGRTRSVQDILKFRGKELTNASVITSTASTLIGMDASLDYGRDKSLLADYVEEYYDEIAPWVTFGKAVSKDSPILQSRTLGHRAVRSISASALAALCVHMAREGAHPDTMKEFFTGASKGFNLSVDELIHLTPERLTILQALNRRLQGGTPLARISGGSSATGLLSEFATYIMAYNRFVANEKISIIRGFRGDSVKSLADLPDVSQAVAR